MLSFILIAVFVAAGVACYFAFQPVRATMEQTLFRKKEHVARQLDEMFIFISVDGLHKIKWASCLGFAGIGMILSWEAKPPFPFVVAIAVGLLGYYVPEFTIFLLQRRRRAAFGEQLVDGLILMANGLRAGFTLQQAIDMVIEEMPAPISQEFELVRREHRVGVELDKALRNCVVRTKDADLDLVVTAIEITRQLGGNLAEVFDRIVAMVRQRKILAGQADALTASGRMQALVVGVLPYVLGFFMYQANPELMRLMWTTVPGFAALVLMVILDVAGYLWVRKLATVSY